jgi:farnesyl diphosphate synthase
MPARKDSETNTAARFERRLGEIAAKTEALLVALLASEHLPGEVVRPKRLLDAMRHAVLGGGKRIRPFLVVESTALFGGDEAGAFCAGAAFELLHCYSLVHDDLPAMDNDDTRRGKPTVHRAFDEATAILSGDALQTLAFDVLSRNETHTDPAVRGALVQCLARASGIGGMAGGQMLDLEAEGRFEQAPRELSLEEIGRLQRMKTGALLAGCCEAGAILGKAKAAEQTSLARYAHALGLAFQIADDLLDQEGDPAAAGKAVGKDAAKGKATFVSIIGTEVARQQLNELVEKAKEALAPFGEKAELMVACAEFVAARKS